MLHPWFYPYLIVASLLGVLLLFLIVRAYFGLRRDLVEDRARRDAKRADAAFEAKLRVLFDKHAADAGPVQ